MGYTHEITQLMVCGYYRGKRKTIKPGGLYGLSQAEAAIEEYKRNVEKYPEAFDYCDKYEILVRKVVSVYGDWEAVVTTD